MVRGRHSMILNAPATHALEHLYDSTRRHAGRTTAVVFEGVCMHNALWLIPFSILRLRSGQALDFGCSIAIYGFLKRKMCLLYAVCLCVTGMSTAGHGALHRGYGSRRYGSSTCVEQGRAGGQARYDRSRKPRSRPLATA